MLAEQPFDPDGFPFAFLEAFGNKETTLKKLKSGSPFQVIEEAVERLKDGSIAEYRYDRETARIVRSTPELMQT